MNPKILVAATIAAAVLSAAVLTQAEAEDGAAGRAAYVGGTAEELGRSNGVMWFEDRDEWPTMRDGRQTLEVVPGPVADAVETKDGARSPVFTH